MPARILPVSPPSGLPGPASQETPHDCRHDRDHLHRLSLRVITVVIESQDVITRDNVSVEVSAVAHVRVVDPVKSVIVIENVYSAVGQIAQTTLVELKGIHLPDSMKQAMARQDETEHQNCAKITDADSQGPATIAADGDLDTAMEHPLALQLRNLQTMVEIHADQNTTVLFPASLMSAIGELGAFLVQEASITAGPIPHSDPPTAACTQALDAVVWRRPDLRLFVTDVAQVTTARAWNLS